MALGWARGALIVATIALVAGAGGVLGQDPPSVDGLIAAAPGAYQTNYATPLAVVEHGHGLAFHNLDAFNHNVVALDAYGPDEEPWCLPYAEGECPLFWTPLIGLQQETEVYGIQNVEPGSYEFYCTLHPWMQGTLVVTSPP